MDIKQIAQRSGLSAELLKAYTRELREEDFLVLRSDDYDADDKQLEISTIYHLRREQMAKQLLGDDCSESQIIKAYQLAPKGSRVRLKAIKRWLELKEKLPTHSNYCDDFLDILTSNRAIVIGGNRKVELEPKHRKHLAKLQDKLFDRWQDLYLQEFEQLLSFTAIFPGLCHCLTITSDRAVIRRKLKKIKLKFALKAIDLAESLEDMEKLVARLDNGGCAKALHLALDKRNRLYRQAIDATEDLSQLKQLYRRQVECGAETTLDTLAKIIALSKS